MLGGGGSAVGGLEHGQIHGHIGLISIQGLRRLCGRSREALESRFLDATVADRVGSVPAPAGGGGARVTRGPRATTGFD